MARPSKCPREFRERAVRLVAEAVERGDYRRSSRRSAQVDQGKRPGKTSEELAEIRI